MSMQTIDFRIDDDGVAIVTVDVPGKPMNVITPEFMDDIAEAAGRIASDDSIKGAVVTSGKNSFMAGADLKDMVATFDQRDDAAEVYGWCRKLQQAYRKLETTGKPVAAVVADHPGVKLGQPEVQIGLMPGAGGTQRLLRLMGVEKSLRMNTEGKHIAPKDALDMGFIDELAEPGKEVEAAKAWVLSTEVTCAPWDVKGFKVPGGAGLFNPGIVQTQTVGAALMQKMTSHNYPAPLAIMAATYEGSVLPIDKALDVESKYFTQLLMDPTSRNMTRTLFLNKGAADKLVRRPREPEKRPVTRLGILGAGMMGAGIAYVSALAGIEVVLLDTSQEAAEKGKAYSEGLLKKAIERGRSTEQKAAALLGLIKPTTSYHDLAGCDLVIEAVFESVKIKADVTAKTEAVVPESCIFASNTSTLPITGLAEASERPEQFIGIHFFSPVDKMPLVEVILGKKTNDVAIARSLDYIQQIRKTPIVVNDSRGFYTSRVFSTFTAEGIHMLAEGVNPALVENAARMAGMPVGPLAVTDEVTLELAYKIGKETAAALGRDYPADLSQEVVQKMVEELDRKGKRFGKGFYDYPKDAKKHLWPGLAEHFPAADEQPDVGELKRRLLTIQALETARCFEEGVLTHAEDADIGSIFGWGFPPYTGGTLSYIDTIGIREFVTECDRMAAAYGERFKASDWLRARAQDGQDFYS
jgi:3-hydroxyacyl-CoA dehydrogenase/enoyl-CoA hydratase/3-hydroxybutyryl-CoA epimerase